MRSVIPPLSCTTSTIAPATIASAFERNLAGQVDRHGVNDDPLERLRRQVADADAADDHRPATGAERFMRSAEWVLGAGLVLAVASQTYNVACAALGCANSGIGLPFLFVAAMAGVFAIGLYRKLLQDWRFQWGRRLAASGVVLLLIGVLLVLPVQRSGQVLMEQKAVQQAERVKADAARQVAEEAWRAGLRARGDHGPPGVVPPSLRVEAGDTGIIVTNITQKPLSVALFRVREDAAAPGGWRACSMHTAGTRGAGLRFYRYSLGPGERTTFVNFEPCAASFKDALIEYRIGQHPDESGWWSDSALAAPNRRDDADGK